MALSEEDRKELDYHLLKLSMLLDRALQDWKGNDEQKNSSRSHN